MLAITAEDLIGPIAAECHGHVFARALVEDVAGQCALVGEGLVHARKQTVVVLRKILGAQRKCGVVAIDVLRHRFGERRLIVVLLLVSNAEGAQIGLVLFGQRRYNAAIEPAAEECAYGHIADQADADGIVQ